MTYRMCFELLIRTYAKAATACWGGAQEGVGEPTVPRGGEQRARLSADRQERVPRTVGSQGAAGRQRRIAPAGFCNDV